MRAIDRKTALLGGVIILLIGVIVGVLMNRNSDPMDAMSSHMGHSTSHSNFAGSDIMFLQMMIPHHQQAIDISQLAIKTSKDSELLALAQKIATDQAAEIVQMKAWLKEAGATEDPGHSMSGMGGMLTESELTELQASSGKEFDQLWLKGMIDHHDGAIHMSMMIEDAQNEEIRAFGSKIVADQSAQIKQMKAMLERIK